MTIGADPELCIVSPLTNRAISANSILSVGNATSPTTEFGLDGNPRTLELRPHFATSPLELASNIFHILEDAKTKFPQVFRMNLRASWEGQPIGGHIHIGYPDIGNGLNGRDAHQQLLSQLIRELDLLLALPVSFVENKTHFKSRKNSGYGKMGDYRTDFAFGIEYRTLPSWLSSRKFTESVLSTAWTIANKVLVDDGGASKKAINELPINDMRVVFNSGASGVLRPHLLSLIKDLKTYPLYKDYQKQIDYLMECSKSGRVLMNTEVKAGWMIKFVRLVDMRLENLSHLVEKLGDAISLSVSTMGDDCGASTDLVGGSQYRCAEITDNVSIALRAIVGADVLQSLTRPAPCKVIGLKAGRGNIVNIVIPEDKSASVGRLHEIIVTICKLMDEPSAKVTVTTWGRESHSIEISRRIREKTNYLAEAITLIVWLFVNREVYKSTITDKRGRTIKLPFSIHNAVEPLIKTIKKHERNNKESISTLIDDDGQFDKAKILGICRTQLLPRLYEASIAGHGSIRVSRDIVEAINHIRVERVSNTTCKVCNGTLEEELYSHLRGELCDYHVYVEVARGVRGDSV